jgi:Glyoxalase superfamily protein
MRDFRDAKVMARALRDALKAQAIETTHAEALELIAKAFGFRNWNILSAKIEAAEPKPSDERSASGDAGPPKRITRTRDRHWERADPSQITRLAVKDIGYEQRGFHWEKASIKVYLHGQSVDITQGVVSTGNKGAGDLGIMLGRAYLETPELHRILNHSHRLLKETRVSRLNGFGKVVGGNEPGPVEDYRRPAPLTLTTTLLALTDAGRATLRALLRDH